MTKNLKLDTHIWFRGHSFPFGQLSPAELHVKLQDFIWDSGAGESDRDELYVSSNYKLMGIYSPVKSEVTHYDDHGEAMVLEDRVFDVILRDASGSEFRKTFSRIRKASEH